MFKTMKETLSNVAQIFLVGLLLPIIFLIVGKIGNGDTVSFFAVDVFGQVPVFQDIMNGLNAVLQMQSSELAGNPALYLVHIETVLATMEETIFQVLHISLCAALCNTIWDILRGFKLVRGAHIISSVVGVIVGYIIFSVYDLPLFTSCFLALLYVVLDMIFVQELYWTFWDLFLKYLLSGFKLGVEMLSIVLVSCVIAMLFIMGLGVVENVWRLFGIYLLIATPWVVTVVLKSYLLS